MSAPHEETKKRNELLIALERVHGLLQNAIAAADLTRAQDYAWKADSAVLAALATETLAEEHMRRVHGDGSECHDGCDAAPLPERQP